MIQLTEYIFVGAAILLIGAIYVFILKSCDDDNSKSNKITFIDNWYDPKTTLPVDGSRCIIVIRGVFVQIPAIFKTNMYGPVWESDWDEYSVSEVIRWSYN